MILIITDHKPWIYRNHYHVVIIIFRNTRIKVIVILKYLLCFNMDIDFISISFLWPIFTLLSHCTYIDSYIINTNQSFKQRETNVHNHHLMCFPQWFSNPPHYYHCICPSNASKYGLTNSFALSFPSTNFKL